jgi:IS1 transposase
VPPAPPPSEGLVLELDELCSFVGKRANKRWVWVVLARHSRQVLAYVVGDRGERTSAEGYGGGYPKATKGGVATAISGRRSGR